MSVKDINIKNRTYCFFNDIIIKDFDPNNIRTDKKSYKAILTCHIRYVTIKKDLKNYNVNPFDFIFDIVNGYVEEINENKYLMLVPSNESKKIIQKYEELWIKIKDLIRSITKNLDDYCEKYVKIKFNSGNNLPLNEPVEISIVTIVVRAVFHENNKYYPQVFFR